MTTIEAAEALGCSTQNVRRLAAAGILRGTRERDGWHFAAEEVARVKSLERKAGRPRRGER